MIQPGFFIHRRCLLAVQKYMLLLTGDSTIFPERISIRVIDPFTIKPLDFKTIADHTRATRGRILTVEDHYYEGTFP